MMKKERDGTYLYEDLYGQIWRLIPSGERSIPFIIELVSKP